MFSGDVNVGGIVAAVIIVALTIAVIGLALWYANRKGYLPSKYWLINLLLLLAYNKYQVYNYINNIKTGLHLFSLKPRGIGMGRLDKSESFKGVDKVKVVDG